jgi:hypothetical protein
VTPIRSDALAPVANWPRLVRVRQRFGGEPLTDVPAATRAALAELDLGARVQPGARIAITAGSRGVLNIVAVTRTVVEVMRELGAEPFVIPAMGSHGGATPPGQMRLLAGYGITPEAVGAPVISRGEVVELGVSPSGIPLCADKLAAEADGLLLINRVKPHTDFHGVIESGPTKMLAIGLGKQRSALACHTWFVERGYEAVIREVGDALWARLPLLGALGLVENGHHATVRVGAVRPASHEADESALLALAREVFADLPFTRLDVLLVDQMGKDISGTGMDPNVTGADPAKLHARRESPFIWRVCVRGLSAGTHGNATGLGQADFVLARCAEQVDWQATAINAVTAASPEGARCPVVCATDLDLLRAAFQTSGPRPPEAKRLVWVRDTLRLDEFWASQALADEARAHPRCEVLGAPRELAFGPDGALFSPWE